MYKILLRSSKGILCCLNSIKGEWLGRSSDWNAFAYRWNQANTRLFSNLVKLFDGFLHLVGQGCRFHSERTVYLKKVVVCVIWKLALDTILIAFQNLGAKSDCYYAESEWRLDCPWKLWSRSIGSHWLDEYNLHTQTARSLQLHEVPGLLTRWPLHCHGWRWLQGQLFLCLSA